MIRYVYKKPYVRVLMSAYDTAGTLFLKRKAPKDLPEAKTICLILLHQIGDVVMTTPTIDAVHQIFPEATLHLIAGTGPAQILKTNPWKATVHPFDATWQKVVRQLQDEKTATPKESFLHLLNNINPEVAVVFHPDLVVNQLLGKSNIPLTIGFNNAGGGFWLTHPITLPESGHQIKRNFTLAEKLANLFHKPSPESGEMRLAVTPETEQSVKKILKAENISPGKLVVLHPFASAPTKNWLPERWEEVITYLREKKYQPVLIGGKNDELPVKPQVHSLAGKLSLEETTALIHLSQLFIGVDSGPAHIAAALGTPVISIFSSAHDPERWAPSGKNITILHHPVNDRKAYPYEMRDLPPGIPGNPYSEGIQTHEVIEAINKSLSG